ncbi:MAG: sugar transferase [Acidimicrobiia bacterium]|nr:sugar transferase [Acidimicrobiia bacterium]
MGAAHARPLFPSVFPSKTTWYTEYGKRIVDIALAGISLIILIPVLVALALMVRVNLGSGGVIYRQKRVGRDGQPFDIYKFRSMLPDRRLQSQPFVGTDRRKIHKCDSDPRHTPFGRFIRAHSLDELPQLLNVLKGDMSLVGPRPELVAVASRTGLAAHPRHQERPGITGMFQVSPFRSTNRIAAGLHLDVAYVADVRFTRDLAIMLKTIGVLLGRRP